MAHFQKTKLALSILPLTLCLSACDEDNTDPFAITAPDSYAFEVQTEGRNINSVDYTEASTRLALIKELSYLISSDYLQQVGENQGSEAVLALLNTIYEGGTFTNQTSLVNSNIYNLYDPDNQQDDGPTPILGLVDDNSLLEIKTFDQLAPNVSLKSIMPGIGAPLIQEKDGIKRFVGWTFLDVAFEDTPDYLIQKWFAAIATIASDGDTTTKYINTLNYKVLIENFLMGSIAYLQSINIHLGNEIGLSSGLEQDTQSGTSPIENHWDMAFGYFGASINANQLDIPELSSTGAQDANGDGLIHYSGEYQYNFAQNAAKRDQDSIYSSTRFFRDINQGFLMGRSYLANPYGNLTEDQIINYVVNEKNTISQQWDASLAAKAIAHTNAIGAIASLWDVSPVYDHIYIEQWSELKSTLLIMQYNSNTKISLEKLESFQQDVGIKPNKSANINLFLNKLFDMREELQDLYEFSDEDTENW